MEREFGRSRNAEKDRLGLVDVAIIGGGPAGAAAAVSCAANGLDVVLFERAPFPRLHPGETLHPGVESLFRSLGILSDVNGLGFKRFSGIRHIREQFEEFAAFGQDERGSWLGYHAWRSDLDALLLSRARKMGVEVLQPSGTTDAIVKAGRIDAVSTRHRFVRCRFVIDASAQGGFLKRKLSLATRQISPRLTARYAYFNDPGNKWMPMGFDPTFKLGSDGWDWIARVRTGMINWCGLDLHGGRRRPPRQVQSLDNNTCIYGADVTWRFVSQCAGAGFFLVGDAASILDPAASHGVLKALMSGMMAGHLVSNIVRGTIQEHSAVSGYVEWLKDWFLRDVLRLRDFYRQYKDSPAWLEDIPISIAEL